MLCSDWLTKFSCLKEHRYHGCCYKSDPATSLDLASGIGNAVKAVAFLARASVKRGFGITGRILGVFTIGVVAAACNDSDTGQKIPISSSGTFQTNNAESILFEQETDDQIVSAPTLANTVAAPVEAFPPVYLYNDSDGIPRLKAPLHAPMGFNPWNTFRCNVGRDLITGMADEIVRLGLDKVGFEYVNLDDCWMGKRDADGELTANQGPGIHSDTKEPIQKFPDSVDANGRVVPGIKSLADYILAKGLKFGIYSSPRDTCASYWDGYDLGKGVNSYGNEEKDVKTFLSWGVSYLKYDRCRASTTRADTDYLPPSNEVYPLFTAMRDAIAKSSADMFYSTNLDFAGDGLAHSKGANVSEISQTSRVAGDISDFKSIITQIDAANELQGYAVPGYWNDMDMMQVGNLKGANLNRVNMGMWAIMNSPMLIGSDIRGLDTKDSEALNILSNKEIIALNKDSLNTQAVIVRSGGNTQVWAKPLFAKGERAVALLNKNSKDAEITVKWSDLKLKPRTSNVRNLWERKDVGEFENEYTVKVPGNDVVMLKITGEEIPIDGQDRVLLANDAIYTSNSYLAVRQNFANDGRRLAINGVIYDNGIGVNAPSQMQFRLDKACKNFSVTVGIDDQIVRQEPGSKGFGKIKFQVWGDGRLLSETKVLERNEVAELRADVSDVTVLRLIARLGYNRDNAQWFGYANWIAPTITCAGDGE